MNEDEIQRKTEILNALKRRKHEREKQAALLGVGADPIVRMEIDDLEKQIKAIEYELDSNDSPISSDVLAISASQKYRLQRKLNALQREWKLRDEKLSRMR